VRMDKNSFLKLLELIAPFESFHAQSRNRYVTYYKHQTPIWIQLMVVLIRLGCHGNGVSLGAVGRNCGYSIGTVVNFTKRVFGAIRSLEKHFLFWPKSRERKKISKRFLEKYGIPGVVGIVDGTHVIFSQKPVIDGETYYCRKQFYSTNTILICDDKGYIRYYIIGTV